MGNMAVPGPRPPAYGPPPPMPIPGHRPPLPQMHSPLMHPGLLEHGTTPPGMYGSPGRGLFPPSYGPSISHLAKPLTSNTNSCSERLPLAADAVYSLMCSFMQA